VSVKKIHISQLAFAEQAVLQALASATTPMSSWLVDALSTDPPRFRHSVSEV